MLLRSSSTPVLGSLIPSFNDGITNHHHESSCCSGSPSLFKHNQSVVSKRSSYHSSPTMSPDLSSSSSRGGGFRRVRSDGNLEALAAYDSGNEKGSGKEEPHVNHRPPRFPTRMHTRCSTLDTIPSFSLSSSETLDEGDLLEEEEGVEVNDVLIGRGKTELCDDLKVDAVVGSSGYGRDEMHIASGLGIQLIASYHGDGEDGGGGRKGGNGGLGGGGGGYNPGGGEGDDMQGTEEYYKRMVLENPGDSLFLRNYAHFLHQTKKDLKGAEEYYSRAILVDPSDGDILSQYAKLVWELHHDEDRASAYFERSVQASPHNCHVHAAYASFLWEVDQDEVPVEMDAVSMHQHFSKGSMASAGA
ncbi:hypothetical protein LINPERHAP2_LOCUS6424 [Linum perenne]